MDYLISLYKSAYEGYAALLGSDIIVFIVLMALLAGGVVIAFFNKKYHNIIPWLAVVLVVPGIGTAAAGIAALILYFIFGRKNIWPRELAVRPATLVLPYAGALAMFIICLMFPAAKEIFGQSAPVGAALSVLFVYIINDYRILGGQTLYYLIVARDGLTEDIIDNVSSEKTYNYTEYPDAARVTREQAMRVIEMYREKRYGNGRYGFRYRACCDDTEYFFDCFDEKMYNKYFDVKTAVYKGKGLTEITALDWSVSEDGKICVGGGQLCALNDGSVPRYGDYDGEYVRQAVMYRYTPSQLSYVAEYIETAALILLTLTPIGISVHNILLNTLTDLLTGGL